MCALHGAEMGLPSQPAVSLGLTPMYPLGRTWSCSRGTDTRCSRKQFLNPFYFEIVVDLHAIVRSNTEQSIYPWKHLAKLCNNITTRKLTLIQSIGFTGVSDFTSALAPVFVYVRVCNFITCAELCSPHHSHIGVLSQDPSRHPL